MNYPAGSPWAIAVGSIDLEVEATPGTQSTGPSKFLNLLKPDVQGYTEICAAFGADVVDFFFFSLFSIFFFLFISLTWVSRIHKQQRKIIAVLFQEQAVPQPQ